MFNYNKLYNKYSGDGATLDGTVNWLKKSTKLPSEVVEQAFHEIMMEVADDKEFLLPCPCGCGMTNVHTPLEHAMRTRAIEINQKAVAAYAKVLQDRETERMENRLKMLKTIDKTMIKQNKKPLFERSPVARGIRGLFHKTA